jgi:EAL domain-containing protein (putative c-di-GMP-specific phosphodiesterase class I)
LPRSDATPPPIPVAPAPYGKRPLRTFALAVALPAFLHYVLGVILVIGALAYMAQQIDQLEDRRGIVAMHAALNSFLNDLGSNASDEGTWNEAYLNVVVNPDPAWMDSTWGTTARAGDNYDNVLVTDSSGRIIFGENNDGPLTGAIGNYFPAAPTMATALEKAIGASGDAATVTNFAADPKGVTGLAAISIHQSTPGSMTVPRETRRILWIAKHLTTATLQDFSVHYQLPLANLVDTPGGDSSSIRLVDAAGNVSGTVAWAPDRPGGAAFDRALLVVTAIFFALGLVLVAFLGVLRRSLMRRVAAFEIAARPPELDTRHIPATVMPEALLRPLDGPLEAPLPELQGVRPSDFTIQYQPVFDVRAEALVGVEALLRWEIGPGNVLTQETLDSAPRAALFDRAGLLAIRHATDELAPLIGTTLTVAVTASQLANSEFAEKTLGTLGATGFPARRLVLSLDSTRLPPLDAISEAATTLRQAGVQILLDRFVLTPASLVGVNHALFDGARLDTALTQRLDQTPARERLAAITVETLRGEGMSVTAPGVDRREDLARLVRLGCTLFQGALFAGPMPVTTLTQLLLAPPVKRAG